MTGRCEQYAPPSRRCARAALRPILAEMFVLVWLGSSFLLATVLAAAWAKGSTRWYVLLCLGLLLGLGFFLYAYLSAPPDYQHDPNGCSDCEELSRALVGTGPAERTTARSTLLIASC